MASKPAGRTLIEPNYPHAFSPGVLTELGKTLPTAFGDRYLREAVEHLLSIASTYNCVADGDDLTIEQVEQVRASVKGALDRNAWFQTWELIDRVCDAARARMRRPRDWRSAAVDALLDNTPELDVRALRIIEANVEFLTTTKVDIGGLELEVDDTNGLIIVGVVDATTGETFEVIQLAKGSGTTKATAHQIRTAIADREASVRVSGSKIQRRENVSVPPFPVVADPSMPPNMIAIVNPPSPEAYAQAQALIARQGRELQRLRTMCDEMREQLVRRDLRQQRINELEAQLEALTVGGFRGIDRSTSPVQMSGAGLGLRPVPQPGTTGNPIRLRDAAAPPPPPPPPDDRPVLLPPSLYRELMERSSPEQREQLEVQNRRVLRQSQGVRCTCKPETTSDGRAVQHRATCALVR